MPTLIMWGSRDPIIPIEHGHGAHAAMPGSRFEIFEESGHFPHCEEPDRFVEILVDFLQESPASEIDLDDWRQLLTDK